MLTLSIFQTVDFESVQNTLGKYADLSTEEGIHNSAFGLLMDFLSPAAQTSLIGAIARQVVTAYSHDEAPASLVEANLLDHPLGSLLSSGWREAVVKCIGSLYPDLSEEAMLTGG